MRDISHKMIKCSKNKRIKNLLICELKREIESFRLDAANSVIEM